MKKHWSTFIFELAKEFQIPFESRGEFHDESLFQFRKEYSLRAAERDQNLATYLHENPILFRSYLPHSSKVFRLTSELIWYYDELIIDDPIPYLFSFFASEQRIEEAKYELITLLKHLSKFRASIESGFLLLSSHRNILTPYHKLSSLTIDTLIKDQRIYDELSKDIKFDMAELKVTFQNPSYPAINTGPRFHAKYRGTDAYRKVKDSDNLELVKSEMIADIAKNKFPEAINEFYDFLVHAKFLNTSSLFYKDIDYLLLNQLNNDFLNKTKQQYNDLAFKLTLPYVEQIPPEYLIDIKTKLPNAFLDFRATITELILDAVKKEPNQPIEVVRHNIDSRVKKFLDQLDSEMKLSINKLGLDTLAIPLVSGVASWQIGSAFFDFPSILAGSIGTIAGSVKPVSEFVQRGMEAKNKPLYFLWKAQRKAKV